MDVHQAESDRRAVSARASLDLELVGRASQGEREAQAMLVARVRPRVRRVARAFLKGEADADDAEQLALLAILRSAATYRGEAGLESWAKRVAVRVTLRFMAHEGRWEGAHLGAMVMAGEEQAAPFQVSASERLPRDVREYLGELPEVQRRAFILHHALDHSLDEIAALTEVSPETVKSRLRLGTAALRKRVRRDLAVGRRRTG